MFEFWIIIVMLVIFLLVILALAHLIDRLIDTVDKSRARIAVLEYELETVILLLEMEYGVYTRIIRGG